MHDVVHVMISKGTVETQEEPEDVPHDEPDRLTWTSHLTIYGEAGPTDQLPHEVALDTRTYVYESGRWTFRYHTAGRPETENEITGNAGTPAIIDAGNQLIILVPAPGAAPGADPPST